MVIADISKAFHRILLEPEHRDFCRFIVKGSAGIMHPTSDNPTLRIFKFRVVPFGVTTSLYLLQAVLKHHLTVFKSGEFENSLFYNFYVDNFSRSYSKENQMINEKELIESILAEANMLQQQWLSNSVKFNELYQDETENRSHNVLGILWDNCSDTLQISCQISVDFDIVFSKHSFLAQLASIFDPLGLIYPLLIKGKLLMQDLW